MEEPPKNAWRAPDLSIVAVKYTLDGGWGSRAALPGPAPDLSRVTLRHVPPRVHLQTYHGVLAALVEVLDGDDPGLRTIAAAALGRWPAPATVPALRELLDASAVELRLTAAFSLAQLGDAAGAEVLRCAAANPTSPSAPRIPPGGRGRAGRVMRGARPSRP